VPVPLTLIPNHYDAHTATSSGLRKHKLRATALRSNRALPRGHTDNLSLERLAQRGGGGPAPRDDSPTPRHLSQHTPRLCFTVRDCRGRLTDWNGWKGMVGYGMDASTAGRRRRSGGATGAGLSSAGSPMGGGRGQGQRLRETSNSGQGSSSDPHLTWVLGPGISLAHKGPTSKERKRCKSRRQFSNVALG